MDEQSAPPAQQVQAQPTTAHLLKPHRGGVVLSLGIIGLVVCFICGIIAWVMGNKDLREMDAGIMDPSGRGMTKAGKICGMISVILAIIGIGIWLLCVLIGIGSAVVSQ
jgi:hypothetical protein